MFLRMVGEYGPSDPALLFNVQTSKLNSILVLFWDTFEALKTGTQMSNTPKKGSLMHLRD